MSTRRSPAPLRRHAGLGQPAGRRAGGDPGAGGRSLRGPHGRADGARSSAKAGGRSRRRSPKCARRSISCAITRCARGRISPAPSGCPARPASATSSRCTAAASSPASRRGIFRWRSSPARSPRRSPPATRSSPSRPSRRRWSPPPRCGCCSRPAIPGDVLHLLPGTGETVGAPLVADPRVAGVAFTGSTETARPYQPRRWRAASGPIVPLIAETGGQNAMIVDSSALAEQVVADVLTSAFDSAGQRCSATAPALSAGRHRRPDPARCWRARWPSSRIGDPALLATDVGPVIDEEAREALQRHADADGARRPS